jgi:D-alanyl-D-alanine carboxypeptidase
MGSTDKYAAIVIDGNTGKVLHAENAYERRHPASLTKKMTLYMVFEALRSGKITLNTRFPVSFFAAKQAPSKLGLKVGDSISVEAIIKALVTKSANDAAVVIAEGLSGSLAKFVQTMNKKAKQLGMNSTQFYNSTGLPDRRQVTTAMDMATLAQALYDDFPEYYHYFRTKSFDYLGVSHRNHNRMLGKVQGLDGIKTGFICASGFNISTSAIRYDSKNNPRRLFAVVMGGSSSHVRDKRAAHLLETSFRKIGATSAKAPKFLPAPGTKGIASKSNQKKQFNLKSKETDYSESEGITSKDASLLEASLQKIEPTYQQQERLPKNQQEASPSAKLQTMQAVSYTPHPVIYPSQAPNYNQSQSKMPQSFPAPTLGYRNTQHQVYTNGDREAPPSSEQMLEYLKSTDSNQPSKVATPVLTGGNFKKEKVVGKLPCASVQQKKMMPAQWVTPKSPLYKETSLSPLKKEKAVLKKVARKRNASRKKGI